MDKQSPPPIIPPSLGWFDEQLALAEIRAVLYGGMVRYPETSVISDRDWPTTDRSVEGFDEGVSFVGGVGESTRCGGGSEGVCSAR